MVITKYSLIGAVLQMYPSAEKCFNEMGMHCVSCHMSPRETLEQACQVHSCDVDELTNTLMDLSEQVRFLCIENAEFATSYKITIFAQERSSARL